VSNRPEVKPGLGTRLLKNYFNLIYNSVYDFTTAQLAPYEKLQNNCIDKLSFGNGENMLCVGVGTGNEITRIFSKNGDTNIVGIDYSPKALRKAREKATAQGKEIQVFTMDARNLEFEPASFDKVLCIHVMDFIDTGEAVTREIFRVLKDGGQFVITYPLGRESIRLGYNLFRCTVLDKGISGRKRIAAFLKFITRMLVGVAYLPLLFRRKCKSYRHSELEAMLSRLANTDFHIEADNDYLDFVVYGRKLS
jgi:ubiquinone/menaquinone biosynthesis C-methylase UbiE